MRTIIIFVIYCFYVAGQPAWAGDNVLQLSITGKSYDKMQLKIKMSYSNELIPGNNLGNNLWEFHISDSIYEGGRRMSLVIPSNNDSIVHNIMFSASSKEPIGFRDFYVKKRYSRLNMEYTGTDTLKKVSYFMYKDVVFDNFRISAVDDSEFESNKRRLFMSHECSHNAYSKEESTAKFMSLIKEYPDSHSLISYLYSSLKEYDSKDTIKDMLSHFSEQARKSYYGQLIQDYLYPKKFPNMRLQVLGKASVEPVIADSEKDYLIIFTASWCHPCHKLIPVLKELYGELKDKLEFTYISIDDSRTIDNWPKVVEKNEIPWRCLNAGNQLDEVMNTYAIQGIPMAYLVSKDGTFKAVNLQNANERYNLVLELK